MQQPSLRVSPFGVHAAGPRPPGLGPSDSSDSGSDLPDSADLDTDSQGTGERESVEPMRDESGKDIDADRVVDEAEAGLAHSRPDPAKNGGKTG